MAFQFMCDWALFEDFNYKLEKLGEHFKPLSPRVLKDPIIKRMVLESRMYTFTRCYLALRDFFEGVYECLNLNEQGKVSSDDKISWALAHMFLDGMISSEQLRSLIEIRKLGERISYDREWLESTEDIENFDEHVNALPRYYHSLNTFSAMLSQQVHVRREDVQKQA